MNADDVTRAVRLALDLLAPAVDRDWDVPAGSLGWSCRETLEHMGDSYGPSDPSGFAAMGVVEVLVHTHDVAAGLGLGWLPPADLCARALGRLFPDAPPGAEPWPALLWCTGRADLPGRPAPTTWTWDGSPR